MNFKTSLVIRQQLFFQMEFFTNRLLMFKYKDEKVKKWLVKWKWKKLVVGYNKEHHVFDYNSFLWFMEQGGIFSHKGYLHQLIVSVMVEASTSMLFKFSTDLTSFYSNSRFSEC